jgi:hypothetical protein
VEVAAEKNSTLVMPFPVELLRFLDHAVTPADRARAAAAVAAEAMTSAEVVTASAIAPVSNGHPAAEPAPSGGLSPGPQG